MPSTVSPSRKSPCRRTSSTSAAGSTTTRRTSGRSSTTSSISRTRRTTARRASCWSARCRRTSRGSMSDTTLPDGPGRAERPSTSSEPRSGRRRGGSRWLWQRSFMSRSRPRRWRGWWPPAISFSDRAGIRRASDCRPPRRWPRACRSSCRRFRHSVRGEMTSLYSWTKATARRWAMHSRRCWPTRTGVAHWHGADGKWRNSFARTRPESAWSATSALDCPDARPADEVVGRFFDAVRPAAHLCHFLPRQHLGDAARGQVADDVVLVVVLAAENTRAARGDVQVLDGAGAEQIASGELPLRRHRLHPDVEPAGAILHPRQLDLETAAGKTLADGRVIGVVRVVQLAQHDDAHLLGDGLVANVIEIAEHEVEVVLAAVVLVALAVERREVDAEIAQRAGGQERIRFRRRQAG